MLTREVNWRWASHQSMLFALCAMSGATRSPWIAPVTKSVAKTIAPSAQQAMKMKKPLVDGGTCSFGGRVFFICFFFSLWTDLEGRYALLWETSIHLFHGSQRGSGLSGT